jgi:hypothetical protein
MRELITRLAALPPSELPVISAYLDMRPHVTGDPSVRSGLVVLKDRLREIEKTYWPRGAAFDSFQADAARIMNYVDHEFDVASDGLALFSCTACNLFEAVEAGIHFHNQVSAEPVPDLFQLARLLDDQETAIVAVVDSNTARLFVTRAGFMEEVGGRDDNPRLYRRLAGHHWSQHWYQRHVQNRRVDFAREVVREMERILDEEAPVRRLVLAGDAIAIPALREALTPRLSELVQGVVSLDIRAPRDEVSAEVQPVLAQAEAENEHSLVEQLVSAVQMGGLGTAGLEHTRSALAQAQVDVLLLAGESTLDDAARNDLVREAVNSGAAVEVVDKHPALIEMGGVGALLRFRL